MRCFISVDLDRKLANKVSGIQKEIERLNVDVKFVESSNLHFTIKFLGDVKCEEVKRIGDLIKKSIEGKGTFKIRVKGMGFFGNANYIRAIWLGIGEGRDEFVSLMKSVNENVKIGDAKLTPHMTIGRVRSGKNREILLNFIEKMKDADIGEMYVKEVKLKSSTLTKNGPVYEDLAVFKLRL